MTLDELKAKLDTFSPVRVAFVAQVVDSLYRPPSHDIMTPDTWLTASDEWIEYFGLALSVHHSATVEPLALGAFEAVFCNACRHVRWPVELPESATQRFWDAIVHHPDRTRRLSLKSTAAKNLSKTRVTISKLTEAAWIQDARTPTDRRNHTRELFRDYQREVSHIVMLRAFRSGTDAVPHLYQLIEIPTGIFDSIQREPLGTFRSDAPNIPCVVDGRTVAVVALDRSDAKVTVRSILVDACTVHAEWRRT